MTTGTADKPLENRVRCPLCGEEQFYVVVNKSGKGYDPEYGAVFWFDCNGKCAACGHEGDYGDQSI